MYHASQLVANLCCGDYNLADSDYPRAIFVASFVIVYQFHEATKTKTDPSAPRP